MPHTKHRTAQLRTALILVLFAFLVLPAAARPDAPVTLYQSFAGNINITGTGGTLRTNPDSVDSCSVANNGSMQLSGIPAGATVRKAYLYWAGSGGDPQGGVPVDDSVTFNGSAVIADRTYTAWYNAGGNNTLSFFGGVADVTAQVTGNGVYTFADLTVQTANIPGGGRYCASAAVLGAFSLLVVYDDPAETLRVVNIWEGFQSFRGASITLTPSNFTVPTPAPATPLSSRILVISWEGDSGNSAPLGGFTEDLTFCSPTPCAGTALTDAYNPANNQFNSTVDIPPGGPYSGIDTTWGLDIDMYDVTSLISDGAASARSVYSSGGDLVILANQTMAIPNNPVADLAITKSHVGDFTVGMNGVYTLSVTNNGPSDAAGTITVTDTLPAGLTYVGASGTGWTCGAVGQDVTCTRAGPLTSGATVPDITLTVSIGAAAYPGITNTAAVSSPTFDNNAGNDTASDPTTMLAPDLSTSTKTWVDLNGGDADPGDVIRYTIEVIETGGVAASGVSVTDDIPANVTGFTVVSIPPGATDGSTGSGTGANGTGYLNITNSSLPASGSVTIVFDVAVAAVPPGTLIDNTATVTPIAGAGASPAAPTLTVSASAAPSNGNKPLHLYGAPGYELSRVPTPGAPAFITIPKNGVSQTWTQAPALQADVTLDPSVNPNIPVNLYLASNQPRNITTAVSLSCGGGPVLAAQAQTIFLTPAETLQTFNLPLPASIVCNAGQSWVLTIQNNTNGGGTRDLRVYPVSGGNISQALLPSQNVINVDSVIAYSTPYPGVATPSYFTAGDTVYLRAVVSDPFGSFDIASATIMILDASSTPVVSNAAMIQVADSGTLTRTFEYAYTPVPVSGPSGLWAVNVTANEGTEGTVSDLGTGAFSVQLFPNLVILKSVQVQSDPINGSTNPKAIPGASMLYTVMATNQGYGTADVVTIEDPVPADGELFVADLGGPGSGPVAFTDGAVACGLSLGAIEYSNTPAAPYAYGYVPVPDASGFDANVRSIRINMNGGFNASDGVNHPSFSLRFQVRVQ